MPIPLYPEKYQYPSIVEPADFLAYMRRCGKLPDDEPAPEAVILSYQKSLYDFVAKTQAVHFHSGFFRQHLAYLDETDGRVAIVGRFGIGAPAAAAMLEELIAFGTRSFVSIGTAGSLVADLGPGSVVLCSGALRDEGVSYHYVPGGGPALPDESLTHALGNAFDAEGIGYRKGLGWTTDAVYRETRLELDSAVARGALTVDMEASALFTVARYRGARIAAGFTISDTLDKPVWEPDFLSKDTREGLERLYRAALASLTHQ